MTELHLTRARLRTTRGEALSAIAPLLVPDDAAKRASHSHRIVWLLFQDLANAERDFLWRDEGEGRYMILSRRPPSDPHDLFDLQTKPFEPSLGRGDRLSFVLRANPVVASKAALDAAPGASRARGKRVDVVMHALFGAHSREERKAMSKKGELSPARERIVQETGAAWLAAQGAKAGFELAGKPAISGYAQIAVERGHGRPAGFSVLDFAGTIAVNDPAAFIDRLAKGLGSAKAFGNGLMLIRRA